MVSNKQKQQRKPQEKNWKYKTPDKTTRFLKTESDSETLKTLRSQPIRTSWVWSQPQRSVGLGGGQLFVALVTGRGFPALSASPAHVSL